MDHFFGQRSRRTALHFLFKTKSHWFVQPSTSNRPKRHSVVYKKSKLGRNVENKQQTGRSCRCWYHVPSQQCFLNSSGVQPSFTTSVWQSLTVSGNTLDFSPGAGICSMFVYHQLVMKPGCCFFFFSFFFSSWLWCVIALCGEIMMTILSCCGMW